MMKKKKKSGEKLTDNMKNNGSIKLWLLELVSQMIIIFFNENIIMVSSIESHNVELKADFLYSQKPLAAS